jgi:hypothetical protein
MMKFIFSTFRAALMILILIVCVYAQKSNRESCFAFEKLTNPAERAAAEEMLLKALDSEALYTIGSLKPMSSAFAQFHLTISLPRQTKTEVAEIMRQFDGKKAADLNETKKERLNLARAAIERQSTLEKLNTTRRILQTWRCGDDEIFADLQHFSQDFGGRRYLEAVVFSLPRLRQMLVEKADFFSRWGITENSAPLEVLYAVETDETVARFAGYGYLFGYPDYAVRFFAKAAVEEQLTGKFVERDFYSIPTFAREQNAFVYAVPKNHSEEAADKQLRVQAARILAEYKRRRAIYIGPGKKGVAEMLRDWFCKTNEQCSPSAAILPN